MKYFQRKRKERLYKQWVKEGSLSPEASHPQIESTEGVRPQVSKPVTARPEVGERRMGEVGGNKSSLRFLYILLGVSLVTLCAGIILLIVQSC